MKVKILKELQEEEKPRDMFYLFIDNMSGDADSNETSGQYFTKEQMESEAIEELMEFLDWCQNEWPDRDMIEERWSEIQDKYPEFFEEELIRQDVTTEGVIARPSFEGLTYISKYGTEFEAKLIK